MIQPTVDAVLAGAAPYDDLDEAGQALVRAAWETRDTALLAALDFTATCPDRGHPYTFASPHCGGHTPRT